MRIFLLNGPPRSGKDAAGEMLMSLLDNACILKFAEPVKMSAHAVMRMMRGEGTVPLSEAFDTCKDEPSPFFFGLTPRDVYIAVSEKLCKPLYGEGIFGSLLADQIQKKKDEGFENFIITDSGFQQEAEVLQDRFGVQVYVLNLCRNGATFDNDSRGRIDLEDCLSFEIRNNGTRGDLRVRLAEVVRDIENGWVKCND
ncbi:MAG: hypothetical protein CL581_11050 [Alteromonadaceae bacterium]|nr:hypothetical protein [Alteromonadaceae bacterium]MAA65300.1 hypothetical protein [Alteromonadaceae bacterium]